jgi:heme-degrading monooxygenase HmoA
VLAERQRSQEIEMNARVVTFQGSADRVATGAQERFRETVLPALQQQAGFAGALVLLAPTDGTVLGITLWESAEQAQAAGAALDRVRDATAQAMDATPTTKLFQVIARL